METGEAQLFCTHNWASTVYRGALLIQWERRAPPELAVMWFEIAYLGRTLLFTAGGFPASYLLQHLLLVFVVIP